MADGITYKTIAGILIALFTVGGTTYYLIDSNETPNYRDCRIGSTYGLWVNITETYMFNSTWNAIGRYRCGINAEERWCSYLSGTKRRCYLLDRITSDDIRIFLKVNDYQQCRNVTKSYTEIISNNNPYVCEVISYDIFKLCPVQNSTCTSYNATSDSYYETLVRTSDRWCDNVTTRNVLRTSTQCVDTSYSTVDLGGTSYVINQSLSNFKCKRVDYSLICDSKDDGNGDGICQSGETCMKITANKTGFKIVKMNTVYTENCIRKIRPLMARDIVIDVCVDMNLNKEMVMPFE